MHNKLMDVEHRILNYLEHLWPYISGFFLIVGSSVGLWWRDRRQLKKTIADNVIIVAWIREHMTTHDDLRACRKDVDEQDADNLNTVLDEIKDLRTDIKQAEKANQAEHAKIVEAMADGQLKIVNKMLQLHSGNNHE